MSDEYISREAAISAIVSGPPEAHWPEYYASILEALPAADVAPVQDNDPKNGGSCRSVLAVVPNCGARMDGAAE